MPSRKLVPLLCMQLAPLSVGCGTDGRELRPNAAVVTGDTDSPKGDIASDLGYGGSPTHTTCETHLGASGSPKTIRGLIELINSLPRPTSIACFLESLDRPLDVHLTRSQLSAQPAADDENPRVFIIAGPLSFAIVPAGPASTLLEFAYAVDEKLSVKGEVLFPVERKLTDDTLTNQVALGGRTRCGSCHDPEQPAREGHYEGAFISPIIAPSPDLEVDLEELRSASERCDLEREPERCQILHALFHHGEVRSKVDWLQ